MTTACGTMVYRTFPIKKILLLILLCAAIVVSVHAIERHGEAAIKIANCISSGGSLAHLINPETGRQADVCKLQNGIFGILISESDGQNVTAYKNRNTVLSKVLCYLGKSGFCH